MEELLDLKQLLLQGDIRGSLALVEDLEEMGRKAIIDKIRSYAIILLLHLIKQRAEKRTTKSWDVSIRNSIREILNANKRRKAGGYYVPLEELKEILVAAYPNALDLASLEVASGSYEPEELATMVNQDAIIEFALSNIAN
ncbi:protein of unknown function DUF29 [Xenococcus sp. PCC 7305]|uniref:DUF29 family protein n=1 Tax=Xenococcus sp. PCC 7305 TaxID=102125 RepID=UPI0002AC5F6A|nr:DUF29 family protein [Xenococcus sp. PCC 7305]ELS02049.1 protein of unknown function DUF29 [Xenococcus sp. PCC 7305]